MREHPNREGTILRVTAILNFQIGDGDAPRTIAEELYDSGYITPDQARRFWTYPKKTWSGPLITRGHDEFGNRPFVFRLPGNRALLAVLTPRIKKVYLDDE